MTDYLATKRPQYSALGFPLLDHDPLLTTFRTLNFRVVEYELPPYPLRLAGIVAIRMLSMIVGSSIVAYFLYHRVASRSNLLRWASLLGLITAFMIWPLLTGMSGVMLLDFWRPALGFRSSLLIWDIFHIRTRPEVESWNFARFLAQLWAFPKELDEIEERAQKEGFKRDPRWENLKGMPKVAVEAVLLLATLYFIPPQELTVGMNRLSYHLYCDMLGLSVSRPVFAPIQGVCRSHTGGTEQSGSQAHCFPRRPTDPHGTRTLWRRTAQSARDPHRSRDGRYVVSARVPRPSASQAIISHRLPSPSLALPRSARLRSAAPRHSENPLGTTNIRLFWSHWNRAIATVLHRVVFGGGRAKASLKKSKSRGQASGSSPGSSSAKKSIDGPESATGSTANGQRKSTRLDELRKRRDHLDHLSETEAEHTHATDDDENDRSSNSRPGSRSSSPKGLRGMTQLNGSGSGEGAGLRKRAKGEDGKDEKLGTAKPAPCSSSKNRQRGPFYPKAIAAIATFAMSVSLCLPACLLFPGLVSLANDPPSFPLSLPPLLRSWLTTQGIFHEHITYFTLGFASGENFLFFLANGFATVFSTWFKRTFPTANERIPTWAGVLLLHAFFLSVVPLCE